MTFVRSVNVCGKIFCTKNIAMRFLSLFGWYLNDLIPFMQFSVSYMVLNSYLSEIEIVSKFLYRICFITIFPSIFFFFFCLHKFRKLVKKMKSKYVWQRHNISNINWHINIYLFWVIIILRISALKNGPVAFDWCLALLRKWSCTASASILGPRGLLEPKLE